MKIRNKVDSTANARLTMYLHEPGTREPLQAALSNKHLPILQRLGDEYGMDIDSIRCRLRREGYFVPDRKKKDKDQPPTKQGELVLGQFGDEPKGQQDLAESLRKIEGLAGALDEKVTKIQHLMAENIHLRNAVELEKLLYAQAQKPVEVLAEPTSTGHWWIWEPAANPPRWVGIYIKRTDLDHWRRLAKVRHTAFTRVIIPAFVPDMSALATEPEVKWLGPVDVTSAAEERHA